MKLYFYLSPEYWLDPVPTLDNFYDQASNGAHTWIIQTFLRLKKSGVDCELTQEIPEQGIIIFHKGAMDDNLKPTRQQLFVCIQSDWGIHSFAQTHICQNYTQQQKIKASLHSKLFLLTDTKFVHHWPQYNIIPRDNNKPIALKNISYFGSKSNLAPELQTAEWVDFLKAHNINWSIKGKHTEWNDYSTTDAVIFSRDFNGNPYDHKPPTKVYNSWIAGCLPIFTPESAFIDEIKGKPRASIVVNSYQDLKDKIAALIANEQEFVSLVKNGQTLVSNYDEHHIVFEWKEIINALTKKLEQQKSQPIKHFNFLAIRKIFDTMRKLSW